jgi:hypothetical protein
MAKFKKGDKVEQIMPAPIRGRVDAFSIDQESGDPQLHVSWEDDNQVTHSKWFHEHQLKPQEPTK